MEDRLSKLIADQLGVEAERVVPEASFTDDLEADSLDLVELIMSIEEEFKVEIPDEEADKIATVGDALSYLRQRTEATSTE